MALFVKIALVVLCCFWLFLSCQKKKSSSPSLEQWLDKHFPGRFQVVSTENDDAIRNLSFKVKRSILAEKSMPEVQAQFRYDLRQPDLELDSAAVNEAFIQAKKYQEDATALAKALQNAGATNTSIGARNGRISILFYAEPTAATRRDCLIQVKNALDNWKPIQSGYDLFVWLAEPSSKGSAILPLSEQLEILSLGRKDLIFSVLIQLDEPIKPEKLEKEWIFSADSERFSRYLEQGRQAAMDWLKQHPGKPCEWSNMSEFEQKKNAPAEIIFSFSCLENADTSAVDEEDAPGRHVKVNFNVDEEKVLRCEAR